MPNHVTNILRVTGDTLQKQYLFESIKNEEIGIGSIDFNKILPPPDTIYQGSLGKDEFSRYGKDNWRDWNIVHWGTKWNSYGYDETKEFDGEQVTFKTAWSCPEPVIKTLAVKYPKLSFELQWADEDFGYNVGHKKYANGEQVFSVTPKGGTRKALELAAEVHDVDLDDLGYLYNEDTNQYEYFEPEEPTQEVEMKL